MEAREFATAQEPAPARLPNSQTTARQPLEEKLTARADPAKSRRHLTMPRLEALVAMAVAVAAALVAAAPAV